MAEVTYKIQGMDCAEEVAILKKALLPLGLNEDMLIFNPLQGKLRIVGYESVTSTDTIESAINKTGMQAQTDKAAFIEQNSKINYKTICTGLSGAFLLVSTITLLLDVTPSQELDSKETVQGLGTYLLHIPFYLTILCALPVFLPKAWSSIRFLKPDINLLVTIALIGAIFLGELFEAAMVAFLFSISLMLESWSVQRANNAIQSLLDLAPQQARWIHSTNCSCTDEIEAPIKDIPVGSRLRILPGERIPLDGSLTKGNTTVNQAPITGESIPVEKGLDDNVFAGTINNEGAIEITTTALADDTQLAKIIHSIEDAQANRAPVEQWIDTFARYYTPAMMGFAALIALFEPILFGTPQSQAIYHALILLLIACPCALVISTPVSIVAGLSSAARAGVLIKGGVHLETMANINTLAMDKTGTLTTGTPTVQRVIPLNDRTEEELLHIASAIEQLSTHPLAMAIVDYANNQGIQPAPATSYHNFVGLGAEATVNDTTYWIGNHRFLLEKAPEDEKATAHANTLEDAGHSVVMIGTSDHVTGLISIADSLRENAKNSLEQVQALQIPHRIMLTGDNEGTAQAIAAKLPLSSFKSELLPQDKLRIVEEYADHTEHRIAMIGDGINDAPALARAHVSIAMGAAGSDTAIETADIALMADDLGKIPWLINHARRTLTIIKQNIVIALGLKLFVLILAFMGMGSLWLAILADVGSSLLVTTNALRLLRARH